MPLHATPYPHVMNGINGPTAPKYTYLVFYSDVVDGQMWCPVWRVTERPSLVFESELTSKDCRRVESTVKDAFDGEDKPKAIIYWVGKREDWKGNAQHEARTYWKVQTVPTILRLEGGKETARLEEDEILDVQRLQAFVKTG